MSSPVPAASPTPSLVSATAFEAFRAGLRDDWRQELSASLKELQQAGADNNELFHEGFEEDSERWLSRYRRAMVSNVPV
jgi:hypothetical protein